MFRRLVYDRTITDDYGRWFSCCLQADVLYCLLSPTLERTHARCPLVSTYNARRRIRTGAARTARGSAAKPRKINQRGFWAAAAAAAAAASAVARRGARKWRWWRHAYGWRQLGVEGGLGPRWWSTPSALSPPRPAQGPRRQASTCRQGLQWSRQTAAPAGRRQAQSYRRRRGKGASKRLEADGPTALRSFTVDRPFETTAAINKRLRTGRSLRQMRSVNDWSVLLYSGTHDWVTGWTRYGSFQPGDATTRPWVYLTACSVFCINDKRKRQAWDVLQVTRQTQSCATSQTNFNYNWCKYCVTLKTLHKE